MCTRYLLKEAHYRAIMDRLGIAAPAEFLTRYNIAPGSTIPIARTAPKSLARETTTLRWGLVPAWAKADEGTRLVNARIETVAEKPSFRSALKQRRCLIPASGFYEWETRGGEKYPWLFRRRDEQPFVFAGLWDSWLAPDGTILESCAFITTEPNELMRPIHDRMPVMLSPEEYDAWLDPGISDPDRLAPLLKTPTAAEMSAIAVNRRVGNVRYDAPDCLEPAPDDDGDSAQLSLDI